MIKTNPWIGGTDEEYETQHFGFGAQRFKIAFRQMVEQKITNGVKGMEASLQESLDLNEKDRVTLAKSSDKLIRLYCERAEPSLKVIDKEIERIVRVPPSVLLPEDEVQIEQVSDEDYEKLKDEVANLHKRVERAVLMEALLTAEKEELASIEKVCETAKKDMEVLDLIEKDIERDDSIKILQNQTMCLCASLPFMKENDVLI